MENPFQFGRELGGEELVDRTVELQVIRETIASGEKLFIVGPRRFGKTSLLKAAAEESSKKGNIVLRYNAESFPDLEGLIKKIIEDSAALLRGKVEVTGEHIKRYFKSLRPEVSFSVTQNEWKAAIGVTANEREETELFVDALNGLEELASEQPVQRRVALIIDEFQEMLRQPEFRAEKQIRSAIQTHKEMAYIFAGSKTRMLTEMTTDPSRPFYRLGSMLFIREIPRPEFARFLIDKFTFGDFLGPKTGSDQRMILAGQILDLAEDVPYNVQMLAHTLWNRLSQIRTGAPEKAHLTGHLIDQTLETLVRQYDPFYTQVWNGLTAIQKKALTAVVSQSGLHLQSMKVVASTGISPSSMRKSLESLTGRDIVRQTESSGSVQFRFEDPFFASWIRLFIS